MKYTLSVFKDIWDWASGIIAFKKEFVSFRSARIYAKKHNYQFYSIR